MTVKQSPRLAWAAWLLTDFGKGLMMTLQTLARGIKESGQLPNFLTCVRLATFWVPAVLILVGHDQPTIRWWALASFVLIVTTDQLDGYFARRWKQVSDFGKLWDPVADKLLVVTLVVALCMTNLLVSPLGWIFLGINVVREVGVSLLRYKYKHGSPSLVVPANWDGKLKMVLQSVGIALAMTPVAATQWQAVIWAVLTMSMWFSIKSGIAYLRAK